MTDQEIAMVEGTLDAAHRAATEHLERAKKDLRLSSATLGLYEDFLATTVKNARATLTRCRELASASADPSSIAQGLLMTVHESVRSMHVVMVIVEQLAARGERAKATLRACSFCGKSETETKLVAGPDGNICVACTRLACSVLGLQVAPPS